ncbi:ABC transporter ATP-binding protein [Campylobacter sp. CCUG 57310]|uniref:ABC transporter ATP-binding protein n=1 Tax=Campylobacter sp. CCUG 57310 TaxID=2517362 RepID=UPI0015667A40|nr:ABC transporter ATP-binding protein [Campylobacter sp. CCUG 57310]QKF93060.1 metal ion ABC transporter, ATP-binding protein [Campylobacter sp. CCUG 57310]
MSFSNMLEAKNLSFSYGDFALKNINLSVKRGTICGLLGANGSGKSTFFNCCMNFLELKEGEILINSQSSNRKDSSWLAKNIAYVAQNLELNFPFYAKDIVLMGRSPHIKSIFGPSKKDKQIVREAMEFIGISELADKRMSELSGGQRQLVFIARALAQETPLMLLDEPTSALDFKNQILLWKILQKIASEGKTIMICTHEPNHILWFCDEVVAFDKGEVVATGKVKDIINNKFLKRIYGDTCKFKSLKERDIIFPNL